MKYSEITGDWGERNLDLVETAQSGEELLRLVRGWREKLGTKCGILDSYFAGILNAMADTTNAFNAGQEGFEESMRPLRSILRHIKEGHETEAQKHPFYPKVKAYMEIHPFPYDLLYYETYCVGLFPQFLTFSVESLLKKRNADFKAHLAEYNVPQLREALLSSNADITDEGLNYLDNLISRVFVWIAPSSILMQGMVDQIMLSLVLRDKENGQYVFQRILDGEI